MSTPPHSKIINKVARQALKPVGVKRKGQSRVWLDDNGWWITVIEFQPSSWSKGTYLNVGINFQWYPKEYLSFDIGYREAGFVEYKSDEQFEPKAQEFAEIAKAKVLEIREQLSSPKSVKEYVISSLQNHRPTLWGEFHQGMSCVLNKDRNEAISYFNQVLSNPHDTEWAIELKEFTSRMVQLLESGEDALRFIDEIVNKSRELKKLEPTDVQIAEIA
ncbi:DUF4304 domain-containing protein [Shewanella profunda]|uniref:DUF4304 domain-containing protein n=1 Tax=Shewanella profunda TaxID=254793 RepID=UPI00200FE44E|nr:DUF4304 domain-containing protein [Shewanella profunda]MCL1090323.1 DUF4304 domain-containing protein [Shewanella profunda]